MTRHRGVSVRQVAMEHRGATKPSARVPIGTKSGPTTSSAFRSAGPPQRPRAKTGDRLPRAARTTASGGHRATGTTSAASHRAGNNRLRQQVLIGMPRSIGLPRHPVPTAAIGRRRAGPSVTMTTGEGSIWSPVSRSAMPAMGATERRSMVNLGATPATSSRAAAAAAAAVVVAAVVVAGSARVTIVPPRNSRETKRLR